MEGKDLVIFGIPVGGVITVIAYLYVAGILISNASENPEPYIDTGEGFVDAGQQLVDVAPELLDSVQTVCNIDDILIDKITTSGIHEGIYNNVGLTELDILTKWENTGLVSACEVAILDDLFPNDSNSNAWRSQLGITSAMKKISACTIVDCIDEYGLIDILDSEN